MCSKRRMIVDTGSSGAMAVRSLCSTDGLAMCLNPAGTVCKILIGYFPEADFLCRVYSHAAMVRINMTKAFLITPIKKNQRAVKQCDLEL